MAAVQSACHALAKAARAQAGSTSRTQDTFLEQAHKLVIDKLAVACLLRLTKVSFLLLLPSSLLLLSCPSLTTEVCTEAGARQALQCMSCV